MHYVCPSIRYEEWSNADQVPALGDVLYMEINNVVVYCLAESMFQQPVILSLDLHVATPVWIAAFIYTIKPCHIGFHVAIHHCSKDGLLLLSYCAKVHRFMITEERWNFLQHMIIIQICLL